MNWAALAMYVATAINVGAAVFNFVAGQCWNRTRTRVLANYDVMSARIERLAQREQVVVDFVNAGATNAVIADALAREAAKLQ